MHAFSNLLSHSGYIYYINLYGTDDVCMCTCMWCGDAYKDRVVFLISNSFVYTDYYLFCLSLIVKSSCSMLTPCFANLISCLNFY